MAYATAAEIALRFGAMESLQLSDRDRDGVADAGVIDTAGTEADSVVDSIIGVRYLTPVIPAPAVLVGAACDIARYRLHDDKAPQRVVDGYKQALALLAQIASGEVALIGASGLPATPVAQPNSGAAAGGAARRVTAEVQDAMP